MKVNDKLQSLNELKKDNAVDKKSFDLTKKIFNNRLREMGNSYYEKKLTQLLDRINVQGERLTKNVDIRELKQYKKLVSEFLYESTNKSYKFDKQNLFDRRGRHKVYAIVKKVDKQLEDLTNEVLNGQKDNLKILSKIDDIKGLLLDIIL